MEQYLNNLGYVKSPIDYRDYISSAIIPTDTALPSNFSWKNKIKYILNQGDKGICVGCTSAQIKNVQQAEDNNLPDKGFSSLYNYFLDKELDGSSEEGTYPRISMEVMCKYGALPETYLPIETYTIDNIKPIITDNEKQIALPYKILSYARISNLTALKQALISCPVSIALMVTDSFVYPENGYINDPSGIIYGGHNVCCIGYDDNLEYTFLNGKKYKGFVQIVNSWSTKYGIGGFAWIPYDLFEWKSDLDMHFILEMWSCIDDHSDKKTVKYYHVQVFAFKNKDNANNAVKDLKAKGFDTYIVNIDGYYKIQCGAFILRENSEKLQKQLKNAGYESFIVYY